MVVSSIFSLAASKRGRKRVSEGEAATTPNFPSPNVELNAAECFRIETSNMLVPL